MTILFFVVLPIATILISIVLQKLLRNPVLVAILVFAVYFILAFTVFTSDFVLNAIIYAILAFLTAVIVKYLCCLKSLNIKCENEPSCEELKESIDTLQESVSDLTDIINNLTNNNSSCGCNRRLRR